MYTSRQLAEILLATNPPSKDLGQNYLVDDSVIESIGELASLNMGSTPRKILEIGLGPGALTQKLLQSEHQVIGIELDPSACNHISSVFSKEITSNRLELIEGDALHLDWPSGITDIIANIPYQISSPLLEKITQICTKETQLNNCVFMFQEEFANRINGAKNTSNRGPLWITTSLDWEVSFGRKISPSSFKPQPKINSRLVCFRRRDLLNSEQISEKLKALNLTSPTPRLIRAISSASFNQRRKKLHNSLKRQPSKLKLKQGYDPKKWEKSLNNAFLAMDDDFSNYRPEQLSLEEWIVFAAQIEHQQRIL